MLDPQQWFIARKKLYEKLRGEVELRLGPSHQKLSPYHSQYDKEFEKLRVRISSAESLAETVIDADVLLLADFHSLPQVQKAHLKLCQQWHGLGRDIVFALECFEAKHQGFIDAFMCGEMAEKEFLKRIDWDDHWSFSWRQFRPLVLWAKKEKVPVFGINRYYKTRSIESLHKRDAFAAKLITKIQKQTDALVVSIFGELHLAKEHLPQKLRAINPKVALLRVFQNTEMVYFKLAQKKLEHDVDVVSLGEGRYCINSVPPWVKWQSYLMYLEHNLENDFEELDFTDTVGRQVKLLAQAFSVPISLDHLCVYQASDPYILEKLGPRLAIQEQKVLSEVLTSEVSFYLPGVDVAILARPLMSHISFLAAQYSHSQLCGQKRLYINMPESFLKQIWIQAMSYFGAKLLNPRRKTPMLRDLQMSLTNEDVPHAKEIFQIAVDQKMRDLMYLKQGFPIASRLKAQSTQSYFAAAKLIGGILGEKLYHGYVRKRLSMKVLRSYLTQSLDLDDFQKVYYDMIKQVEPLPVSFESKEERL